MTAAIGVRTGRTDDSTSAERLVAYAPSERGRITVKNLANALDVDITSHIGFAVGNTPPTDSRSIRLDKDRIAAIESIARGAAAGGLLKYGMAVASVRLTIISTSKDRQLIQPALDEEADVAHKAQIRNRQREYESLENQIESMGKRLELETLEGQVEKIRTEILHQRARQAEIQAEIERLDPRLGEGRSDGLRYTPEGTAGTGHLRPGPEGPPPTYGHGCTRPGDAA